MVSEKEWALKTDVKFSQEEEEKAEKLLLLNYSQEKERSGAFNGTYIVD